MSIVKLAKFKSQKDIDESGYDPTAIKNNYYDNRSHWRKTKGKWIGGILTAPLFPLGFAAGLGIGHIIDKNRRVKDFSGPNGEEMFKKYKR